MKRFIHPLLLLVARATEKEFVQMVEYLEAENRILRNTLPKRINVAPAQRATLLKLGVCLGSAIKHVITIVHPRTFARWLSESTSAMKLRKRGRPRTTEEVRELIVTMAQAATSAFRLKPPLKFAPPSAVLRSIPFAPLIGRRQAASSVSRPSPMMPSSCDGHHFDASRHESFVLQRNQEIEPRGPLGRQEPAASTKATPIKSEPASSHGWNTSGAE